MTGLRGFGLYGLGMRSALAVASIAMALVDATERIVLSAIAFAVAVIDDAFAILKPAPGFAFGALGLDRAATEGWGGDRSIDPSLYHRNRHEAGVSRRAAERAR